MTPSTEPLSVASLLEYGAALLIVLLLVGLLVFALRRAGGVAGLTYGRGRRRRLALVETLPIDNRRRLVLVRRDDVEHLILLGQPGDILVEAGAPEPPEAVVAPIRIEERSEPHLAAPVAPHVPPAPSEPTP